jgi:hypothetical protein
MARVVWAVAYVLAVALSASAVAQGLELGPGYADGCTPPSKGDRNVHSDSYWQRRTAQPNRVSACSGP